LIGLQKAAQLPYASSLCGACREVCPVKIDIPRLLLHLRGEITERQSEHQGDVVKSRSSERIAFKVWAKVMTSVRLYKMSAGLGRILQRAVVRNGKIGPATWLAGPVSAWTVGRDLRPLDATSFRDRWKNELGQRR
jgi:L-lactate dehydrogenase complex protein LldF